MSAPPRPPTAAPTPVIPAAYRLLFTVVEPALATSGAVGAVFFPSALLSSTAPGVAWAPALRPLVAQMAGPWLMLGFHGAVTLRSRAYRGDARLWRHALAASALSDVVYAAGLARALGPALFFDPRRWHLSAAAVVLTTVVPFLGKLCFLAGVGLPAGSSGPGGEREGEEEEERKEEREREREREQGGKREGKKGRKKTR
ncbi:hypothetical protein SAMD00023353_0203380 [Rosellinia necatrix]|uniref:DUF7704 domain-containing protein n=1 Tax=Rosellinia necatrix TaxID=77044 RepID=A0A1W2TNX4_ROSNE|nr:hypothetical protein SAMD00023353_0203380 [Rosellinia necatrix]